MPRLTKNEWNLVRIACSQLWEALDITNGEIEERQPEIFRENKKDMKSLEKIMKKIDESNIIGKR